MSRTTPAARALENITRADPEPPLDRARSRRTCLDRRHRPGGRRLSQNRRRPAGSLGSMRPASTASTWPSRCGPRPSTTSSISWCRNCSAAADTRPAIAMARCGISFLAEAIDAARRQPRLPRHSLLPADHDPRTSMAQRQIKLAAFMRPTTIHTGAWRYPGAFPTPISTCVICSVSRRRWSAAGSTPSSWPTISRCLICRWRR